MHWCSVAFGGGGIIPKTLRSSSAAVAAVASAAPGTLVHVIDSVKIISSKPR